VDKVMAFDTLPEELLKGLRPVFPSGFPRHWKAWLNEIGSKAKVVYTINKEEVEKEEACFFGIEYVTLNKDKERWQEIVSYVRRTCDPSIRLLDKFEDMAKPLAPDSYQPLDLEPEDVPVIPLKKTLIVKDSGDPVTTKTKQETVAVKTEEEPVKKDFVCETCKREFTKKGPYVMHSRTHKEKAVVQT
jgi:gamma-glutamylcyclotransferase (GGCT)/AIG2-like uncharacterized protein YtfP